MKVSSCVALVVLFLGVLHVAADVSPGQPLFLSQYLPNNYQKAQSLSLVQGVGNFSSYSGYFTVNQTTGSNMFFWYFPAQNGNAKAPVLLWLQGGPGSSSMYGLFTENGPFKVDGDGNLYANPYTWNQNFSMIYIDNPVGAGWSFTTSVDGYVSNEDEVAEDLYQAVAQFFQLFPNLKGNDFYVTGESYGGKYVPSLGYKIYQMNNNPKNQFINLKGISVGDGMMDPLTQTQGYADLLYEFSMVDQNQRLQGLQYEQLTQEYIVQSKWQEAFDVFDRYLNGDFFPYPTFYENVTGQTNYFNFLAPVYPPNPYQVYLQKNSTRAAIHTGTLAYNDYNTTVESYLTLDWMQSIRYKLVALLDNYKVLIYNGQNDIILAAPIAENFLRTLTWSGQNQYLSSQRQIWKLKPDDYQVAGYVRKTNKFTQVVIRDAGHLAPLDQPQRCLQMIENYVFDLPFPSPNSLRARP